MSRTCVMKRRTRNSHCLTKYSIDRENMQYELKGRATSGLGTQTDSLHNLASRATGIKNCIHGHGRISFFTNSNTAFRTKLQDDEHFPTAEH